MLMMKTMAVFVQIVFNEIPSAHDFIIHNLSGLETLKTLIVKSLMKSQMSLISLSLYPVKQTLGFYALMFIAMFYLYVYLSACTPLSSTWDLCMIAVILKLLALSNMNDNPQVLCKNDIKQEDDLDPYKLLKSIKLSNINHLIIGQLNINSLRDKFEALKLSMKRSIDILIITESKLDETFTKKKESASR